MNIVCNKQSELPLDLYLALYFVTNYRIEKCSTFKSANRLACEAHITKATRLLMKLEYSNV
jgi:hypothetical protein